MQSTGTPLRQRFARAIAALQGATPGTPREDVARARDELVAVVALINSRSQDSEDTEAGALREVGLHLRQACLAGDWHSRLAALNTAAAFSSTLQRSRLAPPAERTHYAPRGSDEDSRSEGSSDPQSSDEQDSEFEDPSTAFLTLADYNAERLLQETCGCPGFCF